MIYAQGNIIKSGIMDSSLRGILYGPVDVDSKEIMMSRISSLDT